MHTRAARLTCVVVLLAVGLGAAFIAWAAERRIESIEAERRARDAVLERIGPVLSSIAAAQQAYVDYGRRDDASFTRTSSLIDQIATDAAGLRSSGRSAEGALHLEEFWTALAALTAADAEAREKLAGGDTLAAADLLFSASRPHVAAVESRLRSFRAAEFTYYEAERRGATSRAFPVIGGAGLLWTIGLFLLARVPTPQAPAVADPVQAPADTPAIETEAAVDLPPLAAPTSDTVPPAAETVRVADLSSTAALCADIARLTDPAAMPVLLARAQRVLDARGLILWMGAGDTLFAAAASGYEPAVVRRLPPISRSANNATAGAWRTGELRSVPADAMTLGAVVAPMLGPNGCVGVLAAEVRNGRESDPAIRALATVIASQFSNVLAAWPAASTATTESDRKAAAS